MVQAFTQTPRISMNRWFHTTTGARARKAAAPAHTADGSTLDESEDCKRIPLPQKIQALQRQKQRFQHLHGLCCATACGGVSTIVKGWLPLHLPGRVIEAK